MFLLLSLNVIISMIDKSDIYGTIDAYKYNYEINNNHESNHYGEGKMTNLII